MNPEAEIRTLLQQFQDGYTRRDLDQAAACMALFVADTEVIGANGIEPALEQWYQDRWTGKLCRRYG
jgi:hypothetical protein